MALYIQALKQEKPTEVFPKNKTFSLREMQKYVNGYVEFAGVYDGHRVYANEEGQLHNLPINVIATKMLQKIIVGDVLVVHPDEDS